MGANCRKSQHPITLSPPNGSLLSARSGVDVVQHCRSDRLEFVKEDAFTIIPPFLQLCHHLDGRRPQALALPRLLVSRRHPQQIVHRLAARVLRRDAVHRRHSRAALLEPLESRDEALRGFGFAHSRPTMQHALCWGVRGNLPGRLEDPGLLCCVESKAAAVGRQLIFSSADFVPRQAFRSFHGILDVVERRGRSCGLRGAGVRHVRRAGYGRGWGPQRHERLVVGIRRVEEASEGLPEFSDVLGVFSGFAGLGGVPQGLGHLFGVRHRLRQCVTDLAVREVVPPYSPSAPASPSCLARSCATRSTSSP
mmetsp:Transcript_26750/g.67072  ORF Transcript_26750/g.67072 Transcript_26750/m.67072 type:complete len:309 (+) Transcript_26750:1313-2239(+)